MRCASPRRSLTAFIAALPLSFAATQALSADIVAVLEQDPRFSTLVQAITAAGMRRKHPCGL